MPGTTDQWPNWCHALPVPIDEFDQLTVTAEISKSLLRRKA
jgi:hypothetical protein